MKQQKKKAHTQEPKDTATVFTFGDPEPVLNNNISDYLGSYLLDNGTYYSTPASWAGLAKIKSANAYFKKIKNFLGETIALKHIPAINVRRMKTPDQYCLLNPDGSRTDFEIGEILHIKNYDVSQNIYGLPSYMGAIQSMLLNEDATLFRRRYYQNGAHVGYIFYSAGSMDEEAQKNVKSEMKKSKGLGNFGNLFLHIPNGREKDIQIIPVGDFSTRDELQKIKNISRDDIIAAHRIPPALASIVPAEARGGFGDITKADLVYTRNEIVPIRNLLLQINDHLPQNLQIAFDQEEYAQ